MSVIDNVDDWLGSLFKIAKYAWVFSTVINEIKLKDVNFIGKLTLGSLQTERRLALYSKIDVDLILLSNCSKLYIP